MGKAKIIIVTPIEEIEVASFKRANEALICAALLQAKVNSQDIRYYVEYKEKGVNKRQTPNTLRSVIGTLATGQMEELSKLF